MTRTPLLLSPTGEAPSPTRLTLSCPFASNCSCVFQRTQPVAAVAHQDDVPSDAVLPSDAVNTEVESWLQRGFTVTSVDDQQVVLQRQRPASFCANLFLTVITAGFWAINWVRRARHPKIETVVVTVAAS